jgi:hypothetical protein
VPELSLDQVAAACWCSLRVHSAHSSFGGPLGGQHTDQRGEESSDILRQLSGIVFNLTGSDGIGFR